MANIIRRTNRRDNNLLTQWLKKGELIRRKMLCKKLAATIVADLGPTGDTMDSGLHQLESYPFVRISPLLVSLNQITSKDTETHNRHRTIKIWTKNSLENKEKDINNNVDSSKLDPDVNPASKTAGVPSVPAKRSTSEVGSRTRIQKTKKIQHRSRSERERRRLRKKEDPNRIARRLVLIDIFNPPESMPLLQRYEAQKKKKKEHVLPKIITTYGEDQDELQGIDSSLPISKARGISTENDSVSEETESSYRKLPTFTDKGKKQKRSIRKEPDVTDKKLKTSNPSCSNHSESTNDGTAQIATTSDHKISVKNCNSEKIMRDSGLISEPEQEPLVITEPSMTSVGTTPPLSRQESVFFHVDKHHEEVAPASSTTADSAPQSESIIDQQTASSTDADPAVELESIINQETDAFEAQTIHYDSIVISDDDSKDTVIIRAENKNFENKPADRSEEIRPSSLHVTDQKPLNIGAKRFSRNSLDCDPIASICDPNPTSKTGIELGDEIASEPSCPINKFSEALDGIFLALLCRRQISERYQVANKLLIKRNRREEISQAEQEFESRMNVFRRELVHLRNELGSWDRVARFIAQEMENRTLNNMKPFTKREVEEAICDADLKSFSGLRENGSSGIRKKSSVAKVICEIDLTLEIEDDSSVELCRDSNADPARSQDQKYNVHDPDEEDWKHGIKSECADVAEVRTSPQQLETFKDKICLKSELMATASSTIFSLYTCESNK